MSTSILPRFLIRRAASAVLLMFVAASGMLLLTALAQGDVVTSELVAPGVSPETIARERARLGLDQPIGRQYVTWLSHAVRLDFGTSYRYQRPVLPLVIERAGNTALLALTALAVATLVGLPLGVMAGGGRPAVAGRIVRAVSLLGLSVPPLLTSLVLAWSAARTGWFPIGGISSIRADELPLLARVTDLAWHLALPALALALPLAATLERLQADAVASVRGEPFIVAALARGVPPSRVVWREAWRPALGPVLAVYGLLAGHLLSGSFAVELVTAWPGLGRLMLEALGSRDVPLATGCAAGAALVLAVWTTMADLALAGLDPRTRGRVGGGDA